MPFRDLNPAAWARLEVRASDDPHQTFTHTDPRDRIQRGSVTIQSGGSFDSHLLVPIIPAR